MVNSDLEKSKGNEFLNKNFSYFTTKSVNPRFANNFFSVFLVTKAVIETGTIRLADSHIYQ
jgi:hypothetical protein